MKFKGLLIKESLRDLEILKSLKIIKEERWDAGEVADFQPKIWNAVEFEWEGDVDKLIEKLSKAMNPRWYLNIGAGKEEIVVFLNKVFRYNKGDVEEKEKARNYGRKLGIPEGQLDW